MQYLIEYLKDFNSKERYFLVGQILGNPNFTISSGYRQKLSTLFDISIPTDAFSAMDYHIDWLCASLYLADCEDPTEIYSNGNNTIKGQQEDIDWLIAFKDQDEYHLILIEAKGVTNWTNKQMASKAKRFGDIFGEYGNRWTHVVPHFIIMSPTKPKGLLDDYFPQWMAPSGKMNWLELTIPKLLRVSRCNEQGKADKDGQSWTVKKR